MMPDSPTLESGDQYDPEGGNQPADIDLEALAEKVAELLLRELDIEIERTGR